MAGSEAEERIRAKTEAMLRSLNPGARIVHELQIVEGVVRIDMAAVGEDCLVVAEIKSERDTLKRAKRQIESSLERADVVWFVFNEKHSETVRRRLLPYYLEAPPGDYSAHENPDRVHGLRRCEIRMERAEDSGLWRWPDGRPDAFPDPRHRWRMLWSAEMRHALALHFGHDRAPAHFGDLNQAKMTRLAIEHMTGREIRRAVCAALRSRSFPRADPAMGPWTTETTDATTLTPRDLQGADVRQDGGEGARPTIL